MEEVEKRKLLKLQRKLEMKIKSKDIVFRMYKTKGPDLLLPLYNILQGEQNPIHSNLCRSFIKDRVKI